MFAKEVGLTQEKIAYIVTQYMLGQGWGLISPTVFAAQIWDELQKENAVQTTTVDMVKTIVLQRYAVILHEACRLSQDDAQYQSAWREFSGWLGKQAYQVTAHVQEQEDVVQETLIELQSILRQKGLRTPRTLWAYALQILRRKQIDIHRMRSAKKRGEDKIISLEAMGTDGDAESRWEEQLAVGETGLAALERSSTNRRGTENEMANQEIEEQLQTFFQQYLPTPLQQQVAAAFFLDGLTPKEIAALVGKKPHEIRLLKARVVKRLRDLPAAQQQELMQILDRGGEVDNDE